MKRRRSFDVDLLKILPKREKLVVKKDIGPKRRRNISI